MLYLHLVPVNKVVFDNYRRGGIRPGLLTKMYTIPQDYLTNLSS